MTTPTLVDPSAQFLARNPSALADPAALVDPSTLSPDAWARIGQPVHQYRTVEDVALALGAGFLVLRMLVAKSLTLGYPTITTGAGNLAEGALLPVVQRATSKYRTAWTGLVNPALQHAMTMGSTGGLSAEEQQAYATLYAHQIFDYINETSARSLVQSYENQLAQKWHPDVAWMRSVAGYGLEERSTLQYLKMLGQGKGGEILPHVARTFVAKQLEQRAKRIGSNEAYRAAELGKTLTWLTQYHRGELPTDTMRQWFTAEDERVCKICGPMDTVRVPMDTQFQLPDGNYVWAPGVHPNCRCQVKIAYPKLQLVKRDGYTREEHQHAIEGQPRDTQGRFGHRTATETEEVATRPVTEGITRPMTRVQRPLTRPDTAAPTRPVTARPETEIATRPLTAAFTRPDTAVANAPSLVTRAVRNIAQNAPPKLATEHKVNVPKARRQNPHGTYYAFANDLEGHGWEQDADEEPKYKVGDKITIAAAGKMLRAYPYSTERTLMFTARDAYPHEQERYRDWDLHLKGLHDDAAQAFYKVARERAHRVIYYSLEPDDLRKIYRAVSPEQAATDSTDELRDDLYDQVAKLGPRESSPLGDAYYHYLETEKPTAIGASSAKDLTELQEVQSEMGLKPHIVQVFLFERGFTGDFTPGSTAVPDALVEGKYQVIRTTVVPLKAVHHADAPSNIQAINYVYLEPARES